MTYQLVLDPGGSTKLNLLLWLYGCNSSYSLVFFWMMVEQKARVTTWPVAGLLPRLLGTALKLNTKLDAILARLDRREGETN